ncbi:anti-sigma regulatory factor (Ser/Thr protein kinase) [Allocatelliglobosispora scoriae]|uniref:Anti-sigma regulatory factor (Ser/Thr protein kinase) n=1 Tax=Allocatelliglobosispora scoriae TaxID=643052 RepID=A0A841BJ14_9ACTN|nr:ATP-binding protein [Allocatelliglobosispora scoriae]MBB5866891.1 anti-sigma regulatory factor (Ser/Thr protein kinase) [Allocatelliglobosispora scoriae]
MAEPNAVYLEFTLNGLALVRGLVRDAAAEAGCGSRSDDLVLAVSELATNAIRHGGGRGRLTVERTADGLVVEVQDWGPGLHRDLARDRPQPTTQGGRGLWITRKLFPDLAMINRSDGLTARLFLRPA